MTDMLTKFDIAVHDRVDQLQDRLRAMKAATIPTGSALDTRFAYLAERLNHSRDRLEEARETVDDWVDVKIDDMREWRDAKKVDRLMLQSERSQRRAKAALDVALNALDEAEMALTQAALAQEAAEEVAGQDDDD